MDLGRWVRTLCYRRPHSFAKRLGNRDQDGTGSGAIYATGQTSSSMGTATMMTSSDSGAPRRA